MVAGAGIGRQEPAFLAARTFSPSRREEAEWEKIRPVRRLIIEQDIQL
jgi:hypothetical protein